MTMSTIPFCIIFLASPTAFAEAAQAVVIVREGPSIPGLGRLVFQAITQRDLIVVESVVMLLVFAVIMVNFLVDLAYAAVDPRLRSQA